MGETISKHIFMLPIKWDIDTEENRLDLFEKEIEKLKKNGYNWKKKDISYTKKDTIEVTGLSENKHNNKHINEKVKIYNTLEYFYPEVRKVIFDTKYEDTTDKINDSLLNCYELDFVSGVYSIRYGKKKNDEYELELEKITLKVFPQGVAIISYFLNNTKYRNVEDILKINQMGRRIKIPYVGIKYDKDTPLDVNINQSLGGIVAFDLKIKFKFKSSNYKDIDGKFENKEKEAGLIVIPINEIVTKLLGDGFAKKNGKNENGKIVYDLVIDDRMYVISSNFTGAINLNLNSSLWYEYVFIDDKGACGDIDKNFYTELSKNHTYSRWKAHKFGISNYSFVCAGKDDWFNKNIIAKHVEDIYYEMVSIHLMQKASLQKFSEELSEISSKFSNSDIEKSQEKFANMQKKYLFFLNTYCFKDLTAQEQGIELYDMIKSITKIDEKIAILNQKITQVSEFYNNENDKIKIENDRKMTKRMNSLTVIVSILGLFSFYESIRTSYIKFNFEYETPMLEVFKKNKIEVWDYVKGILNFDGGLIVALIIIFFSILFSDKFNNIIKKPFKKS